MLNLIRKDILISWKSVLIMLLFMLIVPIAFFLTNDDLKDFLPFYTSFFPITFFLNKNCYEDDGANTRLFLRTLGFNAKNFIKAKFLLIFILVLAAVVISAVKQTILYDSFSMLLLSGAFFATLLYAGIFLFLFYVFDYSYAQFTLYIVLGIFLVFFGISKLTPDIFSNVTSAILEVNPLLIFLSGTFGYFILIKISLVNKILYRYQKKKG